MIRDTSCVRRKLPLDSYGWFLRSYAVTFCVLSTISASRIAYYASLVARHVSRVTPPGILPAIRPPMMDIALSILALIAGGLALELFTTARPAQHGFHVAVEHAEVADELQIGNPS